jgi:hypothetical protein
MRICLRRREFITLDEPSAKLAPKGNFLAGADKTLGVKVAR